MLTYSNSNNCLIWLENCDIAFLDPFETKPVHKLDSSHGMSWQRTIFSPKMKIIASNERH